MPEISWRTLKGRTIAGKFPLIDSLGNSDHSAVFLTEFSGANAGKAAIKFVAQAPDLEAQLSKLKAAAALSHPHLLPIFEVGHCEVEGAKLVYVVMEYAEEDLSQVLPQRTLTQAETRDLLEPILDVLSHIHSQGFAHTRIRPSNISAVQDQLKLSADSICSVSAARDANSKPDAYDAPELTQGKISRASDMWSLGAILIAAFTQRPPDASAAEGEPKIPKSVPEPFYSIASECLRRDPNQRCTPASVSVLLGATESVSAHFPARAKTRAKSLYLIPAVALVLLLALFVGGRSLRHGENRSTKTGVPAAEQPGKPSTVPFAPPTKSAPSKSTSSQGKVLQQILPNVPQSARNTIQGKIRVSVQVAVDSSGKVISAKLTSPGPSQYFARLALQSAEKWEFSPPEVDGKNVASTWMLRFRFGRANTEVSPTQETR